MCSLPPSPLWSRFLSSLLLPRSAVRRRRRAPQFTITAFGTVRIRGCSTRRERERERLSRSYRTRELLFERQSARSHALDPFHIVLWTNHYSYMAYTSERESKKEKKERRKHEPRRRRRRRDIRRTDFDRVSLVKRRRTNFNLKILQRPRDATDAGECSSKRGKRTPRQGQIIVLLSTVSRRGISRSTKFDGDFKLKVVESHPKIINIKPHFYRKNKNMYCDIKKLFEVDFEYKKRTTW